MRKLFRYLRMRFIHSYGKRMAYKTLIDGGSRIYAIKKYREITGLGLLDALVVVDTMILGLFCGDAGRFMILDKDNFYINKIRSGEFVKELYHRDAILKRGRAQSSPLVGPQPYVHDNRQKP